MKRCKTCGGQLWLCWLLMSWPWKERVKKFKDANDCIDCISIDAILNISEYLDKGD